MTTSASAVIDGETARSSADFFERLFGLHQQAVYGWILRIVRDRGVAEDLTVEAFWRIYRALDRYDDRRPFEPWARTIATRVALEWLRREPRIFCLDEEPAAEQPSDPAVARQIRAAVVEAFAHLPPRLRAAAALVVLEELPQKQAAAALGISVTAVKVRVFRALRRLRKELTERGFEP